MTPRDLAKAFLRHHAIQAYLALSVLSLAAFAAFPSPPLPACLAVLAVLLAYPLAWHLLHRFVLHGRWGYKCKWLAPAWKRLHYDHHRDPTRFDTLFGPLRTALPALFTVCPVLGMMIDRSLGGGGIGGAAIALGAGLLATCGYEFAHCLLHLAFRPRRIWLQKLKRRHNEHHYFDETGNFGMLGFTWDRLLGTYYEKGDRPERSVTLFNLGYTEEVAGMYPWVRDLDDNRDGAPGPVARLGLAPPCRAAGKAGHMDRPASGDVAQAREDKPLAFPFSPP